MEYLDTYSENKEYIGTESRELVHEKGLWHNTVHCWLYDKYGNIYFQIRKDENKFYTTASGHVLAKETIKEAFGREIKEEIGIDIDYEKAVLVDIVTWKMDKIKKDGSVFSDRAFANVYLYEISDDNIKFIFDESEVCGLVKASAKQTIDLFNNEIETIPGIIIDKENKRTKKEVLFEDFLVFEKETANKKYGDVLNMVIKLTNN